MKTRLTVKNLSQTATLDGVCFSATAYLDGKKAFKVYQGGFGGPNEYHAIDEALLAEAHVIAEREYPEWSFEQIDSLVEDAIQRFERQTKLKLWCRNQIVFRLPGDPENEFRTQGLRKGLKPTPVFLQQLRVLVLQKYPNAEILNDTVNA